MSPDLQFALEPADNHRLTRLCGAFDENLRQIEARIVLKEVRGIAFSDFIAEDVVRHPLVQKIVVAYENHE